jgi:HEAT repeat protein
VRSAAALAAGKIADSGLETDSKQLLADPNAALLDRLCAVLFLQRHTSAEAIEILRGLASDPEPAIAASALETLFTIDPSHVLPLAEKSMASHDANVRWQGQRAYLTLPDPDRIRVLGTQLNDPHPRNRRTIASEFVRLAAQPELDAAIREAAMAALDRDGWREEEQAALILGTLDHKPAADPLVRRLESERGEVMVATAWALKKLAVQDTLPAMLDKAVRQREAPKGGAVSDQLGQLFEGMAVMNFDAAMPEMRKYIPEAAGESVARSGAIWALGKLLEDAPDEALAAQLMERAKDFPGGPGNPPEDPLVRLMCVVSVGRMKVKPPLTDLLLLVGPERDADIHEHGYAWAIQQISGETVPDAKRLVIDQRGWFLEPAE